MGNTHTHRGRRNGGRHNRDNQGNQSTQGNSGNQGGPRGSSPPSARLAGAPARQTRPAERPAAHAAEHNGRGDYAGAAESFAVVAPVPQNDPRPFPPVVPPPPHAPPQQGRRAPGTPAAPEGMRPGSPEARNGVFTRREPREMREIHAAETNGSHGAESNGHQPPFAVVAHSHLHSHPPAHLNGASDNAPEGAANGAEPHGWVPRIERGDRAERPDRTDRPPLRPGVRGDVGPLIESLHEIFEHDRATASQGNAARCGICYLHFARAELVYREAEGFYVCPTCAESLGATELNMVRRQQK